MMILILNYGNGTLWLRFILLSMDPSGVYVDKLTSLAREVRATSDAYGVSGVSLLHYQCFLTWSLAKVMAKRAGCQILTFVNGIEFGATKTDLLNAWTFTVSYLCSSPGQPNACRTE